VDSDLASRCQQPAKEVLLVTIVLLSSWGYCSQVGKVEPANYSNQAIF